MAKQEAIESGFPALTLFIAFISLIVYGLPRVSELLVYDRQAIINGEYLRLFTAPFVHFSASHLFWDLLTFAAAGLRIEAAGYRGYRLVCGLAAFIPGLVFLFTSPELTRYGGLSGLAVGAVVYLCLCEVKETGRNRLLWITILALTGMKTVAEAVTGTPVFAASGNVPFRVLPSAHVFGCAAAVVAFALVRSLLQISSQKMREPLPDTR